MINGGAVNGSRTEVLGALNILNQNQSMTFSQNNSIQERVLYEVDEFSEIVPLNIRNDNADNENLTGSNLRRLG